MATRFTLAMFDGPREARQFGRQPIMLPGRLLTTTGEHQVRLIDISSGGARLSGADLPAPGTDVLLRRDDFETFGTIAWSANGQAGMEFEQPIDDAAFLASSGVAVASLERHGPAGFGRKTSAHPRLSVGSGWLNG